MRHIVFMAVVYSWNELLRGRAQGSLHCSRMLRLLVHAPCICQRIRHGHTADGKMQRRGAHSHEIAGFILGEEEACVLRNLPSIGHIAGEAATGCILHDQSQVRLCEHCFKGVDDVDMPLPEIRLNLRA